MARQLQLPKCMAVGGCPKPPPSSQVQSIHENKIKRAKFVQFKQKIAITMNNKTEVIGRRSYFVEPAGFVGMTRLTEHAKNRFQAAEIESIVNSFVRSYGVGGGIW